MTPLDPERMGRNGQLAMEGAAAIGASGGPISRNAGNCVQCSSCPYGCEIDAKRACTSATCRARWPPALGCAPGSRRRRVVVEDGRAAGVECVAGSPAATDRARSYTVRARRATIVAGGAFGTPELLTRSGLGGRQVGRNLHIHPACWVGARYEEEVRGWDGVMQSYYVDEWEATERVLLEATFTPLAFGGAWLPGAGREHQESMLDFGHIASIGVQLADESERPRRPRRRRLAEGALPAHPRRHRPAHLRDRPRRRSPLRRRRHRGLPEHPAGRHPAARAGGRVRVDPLPALGASPRGLSPDGHGADLRRRRAGVCDPSGAVRGVSGLYVADASLFPSAVHVNPMMTIIAFAKQVAAGIADASRGSRASG